MKIKRLVPLLLASTLAACGGDSDDDLVLISQDAPANLAANRIASSTDAVAACETAPSLACDAQIAALANSAFEQMEPFVDGLNLVPLEAAIEVAVDYAVQTEGEYPELDFRYTNPAASQGPSVTINAGINADGYVSGGVTPVINDEQGIYADEGAPLADPNGSNGWYFINDQADKKVNWYLYADDGSADKGYTMDDLRSIMTTVSVRNTNTDFFFSLYTLPQGDADDAASWYRSKVTLTSSDFDVPAIGEYTSEFNRDVLATADLEFTVSAGPNTVFSGTNTSIDDIGDERISLVAFSTNSGAAVNDIELLLSEFTFGFSDGSFTLKPAAAAAGSDQNFENISASPAYVEITSGTDLFNGLVFELTGGGSTFSASLVGGGDITLAQKVLLEKLDRGDGYNALAPEAVFDANTGSLVFDFGTALAPADLANLTATIYSDAGLTAAIGQIDIDADAIATSSVF